MKTITTVVVSAALLLAGLFAPNALGARPPLAVLVAPYVSGNDGGGYAWASNGSFGATEDSWAASDPIETYPWSELYAETSLVDEYRGIYVDALVDTDAVADAAASAADGDEAYAVLWIGVYIVHDACDDCWGATYWTLVDDVANCPTCEDDPAAPTSVDGERTFRGVLFSERGIVPPGNLTIRVGVYGQILKTDRDRDPGQTQDCALGLCIVAGGSPPADDHPTGLVRFDGTLKSLSVLVMPPETGPRGPNHPTRPDNVTMVLHPPFEQEHESGASADRTTGYFGLHNHQTDGSGYGSASLDAYFDLPAAYSADFSLVFDVDRAESHVDMDGCTDCHGYANAKVVAWTDLFGCSACEGWVDEYLVEDCGACDHVNATYTRPQRVIDFTMANWGGSFMPHELVDLHVLAKHDAGYDPGTSTGQEDLLTELVEGKAREAGVDVDVYLSEVRIEIAPSGWPPR